MWRTDFAFSGQVLHVAWPTLLVNLWSSFDLFSLNIIDLPGAECLFQFSFTKLLIASTLGPLAVFVSLLLPVACAFLISSYRGWSPACCNQWQATVDRCCSNVMMLSFVLYPTVSLASIQAFNCDEDAGKLYADYREDCWQPSLVNVFGAD